MRRTATLLAFVALVTTAGCRDVMVDPPVSPVPVTPTTPGVRTVYLKGPTMLRVNAEAGYRAEYVEGVDHYEWTVVGDGSVEVRFPTQDSRLPTVSGEATGTVDLIAEARAADGRLLALAAKTITIR
jgi:hypothetical protein